MLGTWQPKNRGREIRGLIVPSWPLENVMSLTVLSNRYVKVLTL